MSLCCGSAHNGIKHHHSHQHPISSSSPSFSPHCINDNTISDARLLATPGNREHPTSQNVTLKKKSTSKHHPPHDQVHHRNCGLLGLLGTSLLGHIGSRADGLDWCEVFCYSSGNYDHIDHYEDDDHHPHEDHHVKVCLHVAFVHAAVNPLLFLMLQVAVILIIFDYIQLLELVCTHKSYRPPAPRAVYGTQCWILSAVAFVRRQPDHIYQRRGYFFLSILCFIM